MKRKRPVRVFSGPESRPFWTHINAVENEATHRAVYALGCKCQELEAKLDRLIEHLREVPHA